MVKIVKQIAHRNTHRYWGKNPAKYITIHETANEKSGATAQAHANGLSRNAFGGSWHWSVDDEQAIQSFEHTVQCWHAGDGRRSGNLESIGIEICEEGSDASDRKAYDNAAELTAKIMKDEGIPLSRVVQHNKWSGKNCPNDLRGGNKGVTWDEFLAKVKTAYDGGNSKPEPEKPSKPTAGKISEDGYWGKSTTMSLQGVLGTPKDGIVSSQDAYWKSKNPGLTSGWSWVAKPVGSQVIAAMQRKLGVKNDGLIGPNTINALSKRYGIKGDGHLDGPSMTIKAMQRRLNEGKF